MRIEFQNITIKNFLSFGNTPTTVDLMSNDLTVIMGVNYDTGGESSRNGCGKSAILDAIEYAIYGKTSRDIPVSSLVNNMVAKGQKMLVTMEFTTDTEFFRIERGEGRFRLFAKNKDDDRDILERDGKVFIFDVTKRRHNANNIGEIIGIDQIMFQYLVANTSETTPYMKLDESKRRTVTEHIFGINILAERAKGFKENRKDSRDFLIARESSINATEAANNRIQNQIEDLLTKFDNWEATKKQKIAEIQKLINETDGINIADEIEILNMYSAMLPEFHAAKETMIASENEIDRLKQENTHLTSQVNQLIKQIDDLESKKESIENGVCPTCHQHWVPEPEYVDNLSAQIDEATKLAEDTLNTKEANDAAIVTANGQFEEKAAKFHEISDLVTETSDGLHFDNVATATKVQADLNNANNRLAEIEAEENPYKESIDNMTTDALQDVDRSILDDIQIEIANYDYMVKLFQNSDSFLRKALINNSLPSVNRRLRHYLNVMELPHTCRIEDDLSMTITKNREEYRWGNLSKGERQRVIVALNLAFQDLNAEINGVVNLLLIDELIDSGICEDGAKRVLTCLKEQSTEHKRKTFIITHRKDIADKVSNVMIVAKRNGISHIENDDAEEYFPF